MRYWTVLETLRGRFVRITFFSRHSSAIRPGSLLASSAPGGSKDKGPEVDSERTARMELLFLQHQRRIAWHTLDRTRKCSASLND